MRTLTEILQATGPEKARLIAEALSKLPPKMQKQMRFMWELHARPAQLKPGPLDDGSEWFTWLILAGRGFGKTRAGAEYIRGEVEAAQKRKKPIRCALVGPTAGDARDVMVEGDSGILAISPPWNMPKYESSKRRLTWKDGSIATLFSAEEPERLRGPQHHIFWADEQAAWADAQAVWDMLMFGMRLLRPGNVGPQGVVTTTPKPIPALVKLYRQKTTKVTTGSTYDNRANLAPTFFDSVVSSYEGTRLGRQEIQGEILLDVEGALFSGAIIEKARRLPSEVPTLTRIVVAIDPSISEGEGAESGIIVAGLGVDEEVYVLEDASIQGTPLEWARKAMSRFHLHKADRIIAEANNGGAMVENTLKTAAGLHEFSYYNYRAVYASRGKLTRAEPVSALYEKGRVHHVGLFKELEDQMVSYSPAQAGKLLVDRMDALVWAVTELAVKDVQQAQRKGMFSDK